VPDPGNPLAWDRYAYALNSPSHYTDPSGHCIVGYSGDVNSSQYPSGTSGICPHTSSWIEEGDAAVQELYEYLDKQKNSSTYKSDGSVISISGAFGAGPFFLTASVDVAYTESEIGVFTTSSAGPMSGGPYLTGAYGIDDNATWMTPQIGASIKWGALHSDQLNENLGKNYAGVSLVGGVTLGPITSEYSSSVDPYTGKTNDEVTGLFVGITGGLPPVEGHYFYAKSLYQQTLSNRLTDFGRAIGIIGY
jgi:hypothetical protein